VQNETVQQTNAWASQTKTGISNGPALPCAAEFPHVGKWHKFDAADGEAEVRHLNRRQIPRVR